MIVRGGVYWADLGEASGSRSAKPRPVLVVQSDVYSASALSTVIAVVLTLPGYLQTEVDQGLRRVLAL